jgi:rSAM/selenodomain-associated transferase 1
MTNAIIIFSRFPRKGKVKTRLAKTTGNDFAVEFYKLCSERTFDECRKFSFDETAVYVFYSDSDELVEIKEWTHNEFVYILQTGENLGARMLHAFKTVFDSGAGKAVIIGTDIPDISYRIIMQAMQYLGEYEVVVGPAKDGGYYLLGMTNLFRFLFNDIAWGTNNVFAETINKLTGHNIKKKILTELHDIDTEESLNAWLSEKEPGDFNPIKNVIEKNYFSFKKLA